MELNSLLPFWGEGEFCGWKTLSEWRNWENAFCHHMSKGRFFWKVKRKSSSVYRGSTMRRVTSQGVLPAFISPSHHNSIKLGFNAVDFTEEKPGAQRVSHQAHVT